MQRGSKSRTFPVFVPLRTALRQLHSSVYLQAAFMLIVESQLGDFLQHSCAPCGANILDCSRTAEIFCLPFLTLAFAASSQGTLTPQVRQVCPAAPGPLMTNRLRSGSQIPATEANMAHAIMPRRRRTAWFIH